MKRHTDRDTLTFAMLGGRRISGLDLARMFKRLTGRAPSADQVAAAHDSLRAAYDMLEEKMAKSKDEKKGSGVNYGKLTADALNKAFPAPVQKQPSKEPEKK